MNDDELARLVSGYFYPRAPFVRIYRRRVACHIFSTVPYWCLGVAVLAFRHKAIILRSGVRGGFSFVTYNEARP